jgi:hypothetical protein
MLYAFELTSDMSSSQCDDAPLPNDVAAALSTCILASVRWDQSTRRDTSKESNIVYLHEADACTVYFFRVCKRE